MSDKKCGLMCERMLGMLAARAGDACDAGGAKAAIVAREAKLRGMMLEMLI